MIKITVTTTFMFESACRCVFEVNERFMTLIFFKCNVTIIEDKIANTTTLHIPRMIETCTQTKLFDTYRITAIKEHMNHRDSEHNNIDVTVR